MFPRMDIPKTTLLLTIAATSVAPVFFVSLDEPIATLNAWKLTAKIGSLFGTMLLFWQFLLGYRQAIARWVTPDYIWTIGLHKAIGTAAPALVLLHPVFIALYYRDKHDQWLFGGALPPRLAAYVTLGIVAFAVLCGIVAASTLIRKRIGRDRWYFTHLSSYLLLPAVFVHGYAIGETLNSTPLGNVWFIVLAAAGLFYVLRLLAELGIFSSVYEVTRVAHAATDVVDIAMKPVRRPLRPLPGQFAFFRHGAFRPVRPFTISKYREETGEIHITVKALGVTTRRLQDTRPGERFLIDGPYGVFGREALRSHRPVVMLAGGIGVTPFRRMIDELERLPEREAYLFYGNQYEEDIALREEVEAADHVELVHVLSGLEEHESLRVGFITVGLLKEHLARELAEYEFLLCGPPIMVEKLETDLRANGVPRSQIHHELFGY
ncbi:MAG: ferric reductase-like transmembrane domain-containing protein [Armatimonadetes bacterium]|nr:ferric reductase-like transmembrane domain-containing protein [Armatimonadota bacterium]